MVELHNIQTPYPFHTWAFDLVGPIAQQSKGRRWILTVIEVGTKWVEAIQMRKADGAGVTNFIRENIICRFGIPKVMLSDNRTPFVNCHVERLLDDSQIKHHKYTTYYPHGNRQAEATNKTLIRILSKMMDEARGTWSEQLPIALWAYRTSRRKPIQATPFPLVYEYEAVLLVKWQYPQQEWLCRYT
ncbi:protein NYNRIN-like [Camellia sinensis]|uniref:protein NYNRIN-like n=1 Tax=Camellia sinensis TaxID=4442 RepID=UPI001036807C|nr:protein NYNRIN-like [Camellia sinensis]